MNTGDNNNNGSATTDTTTSNTSAATAGETKKPAKKAATKKPHVSVKAKAKKPAKPAAKKPAKKAAKPAAKKPAKKAVKKVTAKKPSAKKPSKGGKRTADNFDRNFGRIKFNGESLSKGRAVHAVVAAFVAKKKPTASQLQNAFPAELLKNYGIVQEAGKARKYSVNGKTRYFVDSADLIKTKDGKSFAVCNQFSTDNVKPFIKHAKTLGFTMTPSK